MSGRLGGEGTDQEGCLAQQVERLQYVYLVTRDRRITPSNYGREMDANDAIARAVAAAE
jgi:hypothetical protein